MGNNKNEKQIEKNLEKNFRKLIDKRYEKKSGKSRGIGNMLDYVAWRGDLPMTEVPFSLVDDLILSTLAYLDLNGILGISESVSFLSLTEIAKAYDELGKKQDDIVNDPGPLIRAIAGTERFGSIKLGLYKEKVDPKQTLQFGAMAFFLQDGTIYIGFRGTDNTIVGWKEDFAMSYMNETKGQAESVKYVDMIGKTYDNPIRVGGHSKGGNFAIYGSSFASENIQKRIMSVVSHDGPGFSDKTIKRAGYKRILERTVLVMPESSIIGILMNNDADRIVVKSDALGIYQHNPYTWIIRGGNFDVVEAQNSSSAFWEETIGQWINGFTPKERELVLSGFFHALDATGAEKFSDISGAKGYNNVVKEFNSLENEVKAGIRDSLGKLVTTGNEVLQKETQEKIKSIVSTGSEIIHKEAPNRIRELVPKEAQEKLKEIISKK